MKLFRLSQTARGRPPKNPEPLKQAAPSNDFVTQLYLSRRITRTQLLSAVLFCRLASSVYNVMGGPSIAMERLKKGIIPHDSGLDHFPLWKRLLANITGVCGRQTVDLLISVILENNRPDNLLQDTSIDISSIQNFRRGLDITNDFLSGKID